jgi:hypothetical protein
MLMDFYYNISIDSTYVEKYSTLLCFHSIHIATSFMAIVILAVLMENKFNISITWTCQQNIGG